MKRHTMCTVRWAMIAFAVGTAGGMVAACFIKPKKNFRHAASKALDTISDLMETLADYTR